ncbi:hypothetical protein EVAR_101901_1 [Eumeta japonica]|uniref:Uncharacterized protein n=1 Tax=Eumeta variegata TaxID=151549 RepID=A0A4C1T2S6_EUMVA|nr:hypothetical protein EVAR_101901_1 [Eumeta japonica]
MMDRVSTFRFVYCSRSFTSGGQSTTATDAPIPLQSIDGASACTYDLYYNRRRHALHMLHPHLDTSRPTRLRPKITTTPRHTHAHSMKYDLYWASAPRVGDRRLNWTTFERTYLILIFSLILNENPSASARRRAAPAAGLPAGFAAELLLTVDNMQRYQEQMALQDNTNVRAENK